MHCLSIVSPHARELVFKIPLFYNIRSFNAKETILQQNIIRLTDIFAKCLILSNIFPNYFNTFLMATLNPRCKTHLQPKMVALKNAKETKKLIGFSKKGSLTITFHGVSLCKL